MTIKEYLAVRGNRCPYCSGDDISGDSVDIQDGSASQGVSCNTCNAEWIDTYTLTGYIEA